MGLKSGTPFRLMSRLVKMLKLSSKLLKIEMEVHVTVVHVTVSIVNFEHANAD